MSFAKLKKQSKLGSLTAKLVKEVEKMNNNGTSGDDRLWKLDVDKSVTVTLLSDSYLHLMVKIYHLLNYILMPFKVLVDGTLKTL